MYNRPESKLPQPSNFFAMENTLSKQVKITKNDDGSYTLEFRGARFRSLFIPMVLLVSLTVLNLYLMGEFGVFGFLVFCLLIPVYVIFVSKKKQQIKILPRIGIEFHGNSVPFSEISACGVDNDGRAGKAFIVVNGNKVFIADGKISIVNEINFQLKKLSGISWG